MITLKKLIAQGVKTNKPFILATVIKTIGATPQAPGARMIVFADGSTIGTIGGGCVEGTAIKTAVQTLAKLVFSENVDTNDFAKIITVNLNDPLGQKDGDVCGGQMTVLLEFINC